MTRQLTDHIINKANDKLRIDVIDETGAGGAHHNYLITGYDIYSNPMYAGVEPRDVSDKAHGSCAIIFQNGPIAVDGNGVNGVTHEALMAIIIDRLRSFQAGPYSCRANALALTHLEESLHWLQQRTIERMRRGVEGTHVV